MASFEIDNESEWSREDVLVFIETLQKYPSLWKTKSAEYKNKIRKLSSLHRIVQEMRPHKVLTHDAILRKIKVLRSQLRRELRRQAMSKNSGTDATEDAPKLWCYYQLQFLREEDQAARVHSALPSPSARNLSASLLYQVTFCITRPKSFLCVVFLNCEL